MKQSHERSHKEVNQEKAMPLKPREDSVSKHFTSGIA